MTRGASAEGDELVALVQQLKTLPREEPTERAMRSDLIEREQLALATFADDPDVAAALLRNSTLCDAAIGVAKSRRRSALPWWRRVFRV